MGDACGTARAATAAEAKVALVDATNFDVRTEKANNDEKRAGK